MSKYEAQSDGNFFLYAYGKYYKDLRSGPQSSEAGRGKGGKICRRRNEITLRAINSIYTPSLLPLSPAQNRRLHAPCAYRQPSERSFSPENQALAPEAHVCPYVF
jgi:hypothetical protein